MSAANQYNSQPSILWHDYESWGAQPQKDHPVQFAAVRTDLDFNPIGEPINWMCQIPNDYLPHPQACLVTGITPQKSLRDGMIEAQFMRQINQQMSQPGTCVAGYNNIRFDDELTRFSLYRNFINPYAREWQNGNSRWDIIDMVRACYALRPDGINWVYSEDGKPSFKLELLSQANGIEHLDAHDALSDVYATIAMAKLIKQQQPRLYNYLFSIRTKNKLAEQFNMATKTPLVHISSKLPSEHGCCTWIAPLCPHPTNKNAIVCVNLALPVEPLLDLSVEQLQEKLYQRSEDMAPNEHRLPIKLVHLNKCPVVAPAKTLSQENAERLDINREQCLKNLNWLQRQTGLEQKISALYEATEAQELDPDHALYSGGFLSNADQQLCAQIQDTAPDSLDSFNGKFEDPRLNTLLFRYRGRNYPGTFTAQELEKWQRHRHFRLTDPQSPASLTLEKYLWEVEQLLTTNSNNPSHISILKDLYRYAQQL